MSLLIRDAHGVSLPEIPVEFPSLHPELATRAMRRFSCIGGACEDTCCRDFGISIDREAIDRMRAAAAGHPERREKVVRLVVLGMPRGGVKPQNLVQLDESGACPLLETDGACGIHRDYGPAALSTTCAIFPRTSLAVEGRLEVTGSLACPELARLTLLADDGLMQEPTAVPVLPRAHGYVGKVLDADPLDLYAQSFSRVRGTLLRLFERGDYPIGARLLFAANLAANVDAFFRAGRCHTTHAEHAMQRRRLEVELEAAEDPELLASLYADLQAFEEGRGGAVVVAAAASVWLDRRRLTHSRRFSELLDQAMASLQAECLETTPGEVFVPALGADGQSVTPVRLRQVDERRRSVLEARAPGAIDELLGRYSAHHLLRNPYTEASSLLDYVGRLALALAAIRLVWTASPELAARFGQPAERALDGQVASQTAVTVIQIFTKAISHHVEYLSAVHRSHEQVSDNGGGITFGRLVLFARFV
jgi:lysine-N-methylase